MSSKLVLGQLVEVNGQQGQLTEWSESESKWTVTLFGTDTVVAAADSVKPLAQADIDGFDVVLGPASDLGKIGAGLSDAILRNGCAKCRLFVAPEDLEGMVTTADRCAEEGSFTRLPMELEPGYLGKGTIGKTMTVDFESEDTPNFLKDSPLTVVEDAIASIGSMLQPHCENEMGFDIYSRSTTMLAMPLEGDEESFDAPDLDNEDSASFLAMMWRAKLMITVNVGPGTTTLTLLPKKAGDDSPVISLAPGTLAVISMDRYKFSNKFDGKALTMSCFYLDAPSSFILDEISGDLSTLTGSNSGPAMPTRNPISCVALSERYAFGVDEPWKLWLAYRWAGWDTIIRHPFQRWDVDWYYEPDADQTSGKSYTCHGGFSDGIELFDCKFFDISPAEARTMDPTQRQVLEVSYTALQGAGWTKKSLQSKPANIAFFVGLDKNEWNSIPKDISGGFGASSSANAITSNRFNYCMNLKGASMTLDTACSSSLVATHTGKLYLLHKDYDACEATIICGVNLSMSIGTYIGCCGAGMHSHLGRCFTYNFSADGYARGEATAATCLKLKNFDPEGGDYAMAAGSQVNQDGRSASLTAPNGPSQERCSEAVLKEIGIEPPEIDTTECHGTGTSLGDPIEIGAYRKVMARVPRKDPVTITSSKSNIGHCEGSAGVSGFTKCVLLCLYGECTPNVHLSCLNPHLDMDGFPGIIMTEGCTYKGDASYNGVLSFGFGGTNACVTCWGVNQITSRGATSNKKDTYSTVLNKIRGAGAQEVTIVGDDWETWEMDLPGKATKPNEAWSVNIQEDGDIMYARKPTVPVTLGDSFDITGSFNDWGFESMEADAGIEGLYSAVIEIGSSGEEVFQVVADENLGSVFYPDEEKCEVKSVEVSGPGAAQRDKAWCIKGEEGDKFRVEFFKTKVDTVSLTWYKEKW
eukprot:CAMPEP_0179302604 /NCGR_PEP_ID=MMETSP0797-20121207/48152_1 /TAXON_ID=47934 /ORGANISM="Dinophysis acuminata, Strain DAEP01" /LENGTH=922 /DNA_ID=CAMNT_0021012143 /DNA_START=56 /DNA_END=2824 /DNA_ORIENTATION=-